MSDGIARPAGGFMDKYQVGYLIGSLAKASINRKLAGALVRLAPADFNMTEIPIRDLPLYSYDFDPDYPAVARRFKAAIEQSDAILFVTPEYNRALPGGLKNAIDWASRPHGKNAFTHKSAAVIGCSTGRIGTAIAQRELHAILNYCDANAMSVPETYIQFSKDLVDSEGNVTDPKIKEILAKFMNAFREHVARSAGRRAAA
jgi:chromate reductase, NAD(P)H dehydrogenase (quinone)